ncbi:hypothetical protein AT238_05150 [Bartonella henselae]|nr:hypothetical protein AT238_05150 [Bartonella henselae]
MGFFIWRPPIYIGSQGSTFSIGCCGSPLACTNTAKCYHPLKLSSIKLVGFFIGHPPIYIGSQGSTFSIGFVDHHLLAQMQQDAIIL